MALSPCGPWLLFQFLNLYTVGRTPWTGDQPVATQTQNKRTQIFMSRVGFEPTIPVFERAKTVLALDRAATVFGDVNVMGYKMNIYVYMVQIRVNIYHIPYISHVETSYVCYTVKLIIAYLPVTPCNVWLDFIHQKTLDAT
jgi:hypothetical protein